MYSRDLYVNFINDIYIYIHSYIIENKRYYTLIAVYIGLTQNGDMYGVMVY